MFTHHYLGTALLTAYHASKSKDRVEVSTALRLFFNGRRKEDGSSITKGFGRCGEFGSLMTGIGHIFGSQEAALPFINAVDGVIQLSARKQCGCSGPQDLIKSQPCIFTLRGVESVSKALLEKLKNTRKKCSRCNADELMKWNVKREREEGTGPQAGEVGYRSARDRVPRRSQKESPTRMASAKLPPGGTPHRDGHARGGATPCASASPRLEDGGAALAAAPRPRQQRSPLGRPATPPRQGHETPFDGTPFSK